MFEDISFADDQLYCSNNHQVQNNTEFYVAVQRESWIFAPVESIIK